jgi:hypothetical protein
MLLVHAIWSKGVLHVWGERVPAARVVGGDRADPPTSTARILQPIDAVELREAIGDVWDSLAVSSASVSSIELNLPHEDGRPLPSLMPIDGAGASLLPISLPSLAFSPADAIDLLAEAPALPREDTAGTDSLRFWSSASALVLELLARQRFVPDVYRARAGEHRGLWRVVVADEETSERIEALIGSMPPVCRSMVGVEGVLQAADLTENFLWTTVDALVRRSLEADELAHALQERSHTRDTMETLWLRSLVRQDSRIEASAEDGERLRAAIGGWIARLEPPKASRTCWTCLKLEAPARVRGSTNAEAESAQPDHGDEEPRDWSLTFHVQAVDNPDLIIDAGRLWEQQPGDPPILERPFQGADAQLRADIEAVARFFPPLARCLEEPTPVACPLTLAEAYRFLRDAVAILEHEGFRVYVPRWWRRERARLGMILEVRPGGGDSPGPSGMNLDALVDYNWQVALGDQTLTPEEITALARSKVPLVRLRDRWIEAQPGDINSALKFLSRNHSGQMTLFEALRQSYLADDLQTGLPVLGLRSDGWVQQVLGATDASIGLESLEAPPAFHGELRPYQHRGMEWLAFLTRCGLGACLADDMGLGKTIQLIAVWLHERKGATPAGPTLLVVPMSLVGNWSRELTRFAPSLSVMVHHGLDRLSGEAFIEEARRHDVVISTYGLIHRDLDHLTKVPWHRIALDEAQNIKNPLAKQSKAVRSLTGIHRVALTGTPVENRLSELWSIMEFLNPGYFGTANEFRKRFAVPIEKHRDPDKAEALRRLIRPFVLRRLKSDPQILVDLPPKMEMKVYCNLTKEQAALYEAVVTEMMGAIDQAKGISRRGLILATLVKLKQICDHPVLFLGGREPLGHRGGKSDRITEMLDEVVAEGDAALVFTQFRQMGHLLKDHLQHTLGKEVLFLHGGTTQPQRDRLIERFQEADGTAPVFVLSLRAGGFGLNLTAANHVFHFDRWWNPAVEDQATDRAHRIGQERQVQVHKFLCIGTLEERIDAMIEEKRALATRIVSTGEDWLTELSTEQLKDMLMLSGEAVADE